MDHDWLQAFNHKTLPTQQKNTIKGISRWKDTKLKPIPILIVEGKKIFHTDIIILNYHIQE